MKAAMVREFVASATIPMAPRNTLHVMLAGVGGAGRRSNDDDQSISCSV